MMIINNLACYISIALVMKIVQGWFPEAVRLPYVRMPFGSRIMAVYIKMELRRTFLILTTSSKRAKIRCLDLEEMS